MPELEELELDVGGMTCDSCTWSNLGSPSETCGR
jgi:hypothetical protein